MINPIIKDFMVAYLTETYSDDDVLPAKDSLIHYYNGGNETECRLLVNSDYNWYLAYADSADDITCPKCRESAAFKNGPLKMSNYWHGDVK